MIIKEIMHTTTKVPHEVSITKIASIMRQKLIGSVLVEEKSKVVGIVTERDILNKVVATGKNSDKILAKEIMTSPLITIEANSPVEEASHLLNKHKTRRLVVTENKEIVGIVTARSIAETLRFSFARNTDNYSRAMEK
ncbi:CBS domain-containing protein [Candidatus Woesearchaeota archaeon]|nr:CBS domain-containing protein [Candidatus Woesearchaeota archaeon]